MPVSVIDVQINDEKFKAFVALFEKYRAGVRALPKESAAITAATEAATAASADQAKQVEAVAAATGEVAKSTTDIAKANAANAKTTQAQAKTTEQVADNHEAILAAVGAAVQMLDRQNKSYDKAKKATGDIVKDTKKIASNIQGATMSLLKWTGIGAAFSAAGSLFAAGGGLFGVGRLASQASDMRRSAQGLGVTQSQESAFGLNFGRYVDPRANLSAIADAQNDVSKWGAFANIGVNPRGKDPATLAVEMLGKAKDIWDKGDHTAQYAQARGLDKFYTMEDLRRLGAVSNSELRGQQASYAGTERSLRMDDTTLRRWQNFSQSLSTAGAEIQKTFIKGLEPLAPALTKLTASAVKSIDTFMSAAAQGRWIEKLGDGIEWLADKIADPETQKRISQAAEDLGSMFAKLTSPEAQAAVKKLAAELPEIADGIHKALQFLHLIPDPVRDTKTAAIDQFKDNGGLIGGAVGAAAKKPGAGGFLARGLIADMKAIEGAGSAYVAGSSKLFGDLFRPANNNPGNLRRPGQSKGFASYGSVEEGLQAMDRQLKIYAHRDHLDTVAQIIAKYAPASENNVGAYIRDVTGRTGFGADQHLNLDDTATMAKLISAMTKHENGKQNYSPELVATAIGGKPRTSAPATVNVKVNNNTGGNANVQANQAAAG